MDNIYDTKIVKKTVTEVNDIKDGGRMFADRMDDLD